MRSTLERWPKRLVVMATALVLALACVIGAYGHASGSHHAVLGAAGDHGHAAPSLDIQGVLGHDDHTGSGTGASHVDCGDSVCHGGQAIIELTALAVHPLEGERFAEPALRPRSALCGWLERPPKIFVSA